MPHLRRRHARGYCEKLCGFSPIVGVFGHRQTGKTTFVSGSCMKYLTFDEARVLASANRDPRSFLRAARSGRTVIDECQYSPPLFPALKEWVRTRKKPGQFVLTGSVRFTSRKAIRESLTGRIVGLELLPLVVTEIAGEPLSSAALTLVDARDFSRLEPAQLNPVSTLRSRKEHLERYLTRGGLPGLCFVRDPRIRDDLLFSLLRLMLDRDLRLIARTTISLETLDKYLAWIAARAPNVYRASEVRRALGLSEQTQKKLLYAFESIYLLRRIPVEGMKGEVLLFEDQLEEYALSKGALSREEQLLTALYRNIRAQFVYRSGRRVEFFQYRTRGGAYVPLALRTPTGCLGLIVASGEEITLSQKRSADSFLRRYPGAKVIFVTDGIGGSERIDPLTLQIPAAALL